MITALHGFLGLPSDWDFLRDAGFDVVAPPLAQIPPEGDILLGYSMGGRLALHALLEGARYRRVVIISSGLGVEGERERAVRRAEDERWARRFERDAWDAILRDWNAQALFGGHQMTRPEASFDRQELARALRNWSPAVLPAIAPRLHEIDVPILWIAGANDSKYVAQAKRAAGLLPNAELWICPNAGHRVPWEQPDAFISRLRALL